MKDPSETAMAIVRQGLPPVRRRVERAQSLIGIRAYLDVERELREAASELIALADLLRGDGESHSGIWKMPPPTAANAHTGWQEEETKKS